MAVANIPSPQPGASILLAFSPSLSSPSSASSNNPFSSILLISPNQLSAVRAFSALEAGYSVFVAANKQESWDSELAIRRAKGEVKAVDFALGDEATEQEWCEWLDGLPEEVRASCLLVALNDTFARPSTSSTTSESAKEAKQWTRRSYSSSEGFKKAANARRYLVNVADAPYLSDFSWPSSYRFNLSSSTETSPSTTPQQQLKSPLQIAVTTNSSSCRLAMRIRREMVASLPENVGDGVLAVAKLRKELAVGRNASVNKDSVKGWKDDGEEGDEEAVVEIGGTGLNKPVPQLSVAKSENLAKVEIGGAGEQTGEHKEGSDYLVSSCRARRASRAAAELAASSWTAVEAQRTRMGYIAQISEYWPLNRLATVTASSLSTPSTPAGSIPGSPTSRHSLSLLPPPPQKGRIILLGTGTGSPLLLTRLAHLFLTSPKGSPYHVDLFLTDKLVPAPILALIPPDRQSSIVIAKKYPGNAEHAQEELMQLALKGARAGKTVLRMKQGDPFLYGRGGEEVLCFRKAGFEPLVVPGLSSCLAGPTISGIPVTQRGVAESLVVCTGVGRGGRDVQVEGYERGRTLCVLMGVARLEALVHSLLNHPKSPYPAYLPMALIERASSTDQRVVASTVSQLSSVLARLSPHRPPGMLVVGWAVMCLEGTDGKGDMDILDSKAGEEEDRTRVEGWLWHAGYRERHGLGEVWRSFVDGVQED
ncbi:hypothetical protein T439DRAFT_343639 [Meredithblackwellia eburnea MCA 4105]